jgi:hypothetical protein
MLPGREFSGDGISGQVFRHARFPMRGTVAVWALRLGRMQRAVSRGSRGAAVQLRPLRFAAPGRRMAAASTGDGSWARLATPGSLLTIAASRKLRNGRLARGAGTRAVIPVARKGFEGVTAARVVRPATAGEAHSKSPAAALRGGGPERSLRGSERWPAAGR